MRNHVLRIENERAMQRVVIINQRDSYLLHGDPEGEDDQFFNIDQLGQIHGTALPVLINEGWKVKSITSMGDSAVILLQMGGEDSDEKEKEGE